MNIVYVEHWACLDMEVVITKEEAIKTQRAVASQHNHPYSSDERALEDFMVTHWATWTDKEVGNYAVSRTDN